MEKKKKKKKVFIHHPFERAYSPEICNKIEFTEYSCYVFGQYKYNTRCVHVMDDEASAKIFQQPRKHQKQAASGARKHWMKKGEEKQGGWGGGVEGRGAWRRQWVKQRDTRGDECACMRVHTCTCVHTWDSLLNKLTLKKWAADSLKGVARNHKSLEALL